MFKSLRYTNKIKTVFAYHKNEDDFHVGSRSQKHNEIDFETVKIKWPERLRSWIRMILIFAWIC